MNRRWPLLYSMNGELNRCYVWCVENYAVVPCCIGIDISSLLLPYFCCSVCNFPLLYFLSLVCLVPIAPLVLVHFFLSIKLAISKKKKSLFNKCLIKLFVRTQIYLPSFKNTFSNSNMASYNKSTKQHGRNTSLFS
jgi:hypothetical protein